MIVPFELILIGDFRKEDNGVVGGAVARWKSLVPVFLWLFFFCSWLIVNFFCCFVQVRDEYRTDYDPDILLVV